MNKPTALLFFANDLEHPDRYLKSLEPERENLAKIFIELEKKHNGLCRITPSSKAEVLPEWLNEDAENIIIFHYSGHADGDLLFLEPGEGDSSNLHKSNLVHLLGSLPNLRLVFLNGCATAPQVEQLLEANIPAVIATESSISDKLAAHFSSAFYKALLRDKSLEQAFLDAKVVIAPDQPDSLIYRGPKFKKGNKLEWGLYHEDDAPLQWKIIDSITPKELNVIPTLQEAIIGREEEINLIREKLLNNHLFNINGMEGIGKTTLAKAYLQKHIQDYNHLAWFTIIDDPEKDGSTNTNTLSAIANDFLLFSHLNINLDPKMGEENRFYSAIEGLKKLYGKNLIIIDNAGEHFPEYINKLPFGDQWDILVTSRRHFPSIDEIHLKELEKNECETLFFKAYQKDHAQENIKDIRQLLERVGYHTLTIELLGKTLTKSNRLKALDLYERLEEGKFDTINFKVTIGHNQNQKAVKVYTYLLNLFDVSRQDLNTFEEKLLVYFSVVPSQEYSFSFLWDLFELSRLEAADQDSYDEAFQDLAQKGWILYKKDSQVYRCHQIIQEVVRFYHTIDFEDVSPLTRKLTAVLEMKPDRNPSQNKEPMAIAENLLDIISALLHPNLGQLWANLAGYQRDFANYKASILSHQNAIQIAGKTNNYALLADTKSSLGNVYYDQFKNDLAEQCYEEALEIDLANQGEESPQVAIRRSNLSSIYYHRQDYTTAKDLLDKALASDLKTFGASDPTIAIRKSNLSSIYFDTGHNEEAIKLLKEAIEIDEKALGKSHINLAIRYSNLANVYRQLNRLDEALEYGLAALKINEKNQGKNHPYMAYRHTDLGFIYQARQELKKAWEHFDKAYQVRLRNFGPDNKATQQSLNNRDFLNNLLKDEG